MNIIFMGTPDFAVECLDVLVNTNHSIVAVVTSEDKQAGRGQKIKTSVIKDYSLKKNLKILQPKNLKDSNFINEIKKLNPDIFIVVAFRMLPKILWEIPAKGTINLHASILPNLRGAAPIHWAIINGLKETGVSTFYINEKIDCGEIIEQKRVPISKNENTGELYIKLKKIGAITILSTLEKISNKNFKCIKQNENEKYILGSKLFELGNRVSLYQSLINSTRNSLTKIATDIAETILFGVLKNNQVFYIHKAESLQGLKISTSVGSYQPLHATAIGKTILAFLPEEKQKQTLQKLDYKTFTQNTITNRDELKNELEEIHLKEYALDLEESELGLICIALPVFNKNNECIGAISASGPSSRFELEKVAHYVSIIKNGISEIVF